LIPGEAMVKREKGFNVATRDWEFFDLDVSKNGTQIRKRGFADVVNRFGGNCFACHIAARPEWDLVCESGHGCKPLTVTRAMIGALQRTDPRCNNPTPSPEDAEALRQLQKLLKPVE
jgi:mono/diheme cytochrome c family protein